MDKSDMLIKDFVEKTMSEIESARGSKYALEGPVNFGLSVGIAKTNEGKIDLKVLGMSREKSRDVIQTVDFSIQSKEDTAFQVNQLVMSKLKKFLDQPNEKILEVLQGLDKSNQKPKQIQSPQ